MTIKVATLTIGLVLIIIGIVLHVHYGSINAACSSPLGQAGQALNQMTGTSNQLPNCSLASTAVDASWWMIGCGVLALLSAGGALFKQLICSLHPPASVAGHVGPTE